MGLHKSLVKMWGIAEYARWVTDKNITDFLVPSKKNDTKRKENRNILKDPISPISVLKRSQFMFGFSILCGFIFTNIFFTILILAYSQWTKSIEAITVIKEPIFIIIGYVVLLILFIIPFWKSLNEEFDNYKLYFDKYDNYPTKKRKKVVWLGVIINVSIFVGFLGSFLLLVITMYKVIGIES